MSIDNDGWVLKKPTSQADKTWGTATLQRRFVRKMRMGGTHFAHHHIYMAILCPQPLGLRRPYAC